MKAVDKIRARIGELNGIRERYLAYQQDRVKEHDHHGAWDAAINLSETECETDGLYFALDAMTGVGADGSPPDFRYATKGEAVGAGGGLAPDDGLLIGEHVFLSIGHVLDCLGRAGYAITPPPPARKPPPGLRVLDAVDPPVDSIVEPQP